MPYWSLSRNARNFPLHLLQLLCDFGISWEVCPTCRCLCHTCRCLCPTCRCLCHTCRCMCPTCRCMCPTVHPTPLISPTSTLATLTLDIFSYEAPYKHNFPSLLFYDPRPVKWCTTWQLFICNHVQRCIVQYGHCGSHVNSYSHTTIVTDTWR